MYGIVIPIVFGLVMLGFVEAWEHWGHFITAVPIEDWRVSLIIFVVWATLHTLRKFTR